MLFPQLPQASIYEASERDLRLVSVNDAASALHERPAQEMREIEVLLMTETELEENGLASRHKSIVRVTERGPAA